MAPLNELLRNDTMIITNGSSVVSAYNPSMERADLVLFNFSGADTVSLTVSNSQSAAANYGIILRPYSGVSFSKTQGNWVPQATISAINSAASAIPNLAVFERYIPWGSQ